MVLTNDYVIHSQMSSQCKVKSSVTKESNCDPMCVICLGTVDLTRFGSYAYMGSTSTELGHIVCQFCMITMDNLEDHTKLCSLCHTGSSAVCLVWNAERHGNCLHCLNCLIKSVQDDKSLVRKINNVFGHY